MVKAGVFSILYPLLLSALVLNCQCQERKLHIVYMGGRSQEDVSVASKHHTMLHKVLGSAASAKESLVYSYGRSFNGFAAKLTQDEARRLSEMEGVISVNPNRIHKLHTTRSWDFLNLTTNKLGAPQESDVIIGLLDTGVWPEHPSFNDTGFGPPPAKWKGTCTNTNFTCNNKIIGARYYNSDNSYYEPDIPSPRDSEGHGTHTASTASGVEVDASYFGLAKGVARGGVPNSRIAVYKVCWASGCSSADILKAFDDAIADGVDIISVSLGSDFPDDYFDDPIAIGSFHAMRNGILTSNSAGNSGPFPVTVSNFAPWTLTVAANTIDRKFVAKMQLGNGDAANYTIGSSPDFARFCEGMNARMVAGKIVFCEALTDGSEILQANGVGTIFSDVLVVNPDVAFSWPLPSTLISPEDGKSVLDYIRSSDNPTATIFFSDAWKDVMAPVVVSFSSRGPSPITPDILKPDITAPGVDILAGWSPLSSSSGSDGDTRSTLFNIISGTSMSCPHASGAAAFVKAAHPNWSPAAIKSALMTTGDNSTCDGTTPGRAWDLNYPSFSLYVEDGQIIMGTFTRTVTNVGAANSTYTANLYMPAWIGVTVEPSVLTFSAVGETKTFTVNVTGPTIFQQPITSGAIIWTDGAHVVRTPLVVYNYIPGAPYNLESDESYSMTQKKQSFFGQSSLYQKSGIMGQRKAHPQFFN
ncbi:hypothetical protein DH2020_049155 [Rehmannia glutinosa]|uniref:Cucumisin-like n=1 Tax=Rehmannia glutinosa TaxID=99300 RepID=A0ABR0U3N0_REHGL